ncbi:uncharacterized protein LOC134827909 [Culicoides brevitarsis]|uniref:uncharacterized protein LOC134827909 n=1 Tax=Culicoides brevitarsis TaxID=469753 RepID=UPI00307B8369
MSSSQSHHTSMHEKRVYKVDNEFRPAGRVFLKAQNPIPVPERKSSLKMYVPKGPAITTPVDDPNKGVTFEHQVLHEKHVEAVVSDYASPYDQFPSGDFRSLPPVDTVDASSSQALVRAGNGAPGMSFAEITRNKRSATEVTGSSFETTKRSQRGDDGHRRVTTHIVRKVTTLSRAQEKAMADNQMQLTKDVRTVELGYVSGALPNIPKRQKLVGKTDIKNH